METNSSGRAEGGVTANSTGHHSKECEHPKAFCNVLNNPKHLKIHFSTYCQINLLAGSMFYCKTDN